MPAGNFALYQAERLHERTDPRFDPLDDVLPIGKAVSALGRYDDLLAAS
jgi:hypothetical protein